MNFTYPKIKLRDPERICLEHVYSKIINQERYTYKSITIELFDKLPYNFDPRSIDQRLLNYNSDITLLGILNLDVDKDIIGKINRIINCIRDIIKQDPERKEVTAEEIGKVIDISEYEVSFILTLVTPYGRFWSSASGKGGSRFYSSIEIEREEIFHQYVYFTSFEDLIDKYYKEEEDKKKFKESIINNNIHQSEPIENNCNPIFRTKIAHIDPKLCFVLMPFTENWSNRIYTDYIRKNIEELGLQCLRADNLNGPIIIEDIWAKINQAAFIIGDVTNRNPNVMYELGIAHTIGKPTILITQEIDKIPFDFTHLRHYYYEDNVDGFKSFSIKIKEAIKDIYTDNYSHLDIFQ